MFRSATKDDNGCSRDVPTITPFPNMPEYMIDASTPRVTRSEFADTIYVLNGKQFEDGKDRYVIPASYPHEVGDAITDYLVAIDRQTAELQERIKRIEEIIGRRWQ